MHHQIPHHTARIFVTRHHFGFRMYTARICVMRHHRIPLNAARICEMRHHSGYVDAMVCITRYSSFHMKLDLYHRMLLDFLFHMKLDLGQRPAVAGHRLAAASQAGRSLWHLGSVRPRHRRPGGRCGPPMGGISSLALGLSGPPIGGISSWHSGLRHRLDFTTPVKYVTAVLCALASGMGRDAVGLLAGTVDGQ